MGRWHKGLKRSGHRFRAALYKTRVHPIAVSSLALVLPSNMFYSLIQAKH